MPAPRNYVRGYSFAGFQSNNPNRPLPGSQLDNELENIEQSLTETISGLNDIRRADGQLRNGIVGRDALAPDLATGVRPATLWQAGIQYQAQDTVSNGAAFYRCTLGHIATDFLTDLAAARWELYADIGPAATQAQNARNEAVAAAAAAVPAAATASSAATTTTTLYDLFDDRYLGEKTSLPTVDNDGNALVNGALVSLTGQTPSGLNGMYVRRDGAWFPLATPFSGAVLGYRYSATTGQTVFSGIDAAGLTLAYVPGTITVVVNGSTLAPNQYTATNGTSVALGTALEAGDTVVINSFGPFTVADAWTKTEADARYPLLAQSAEALEAGALSDPAPILPVSKRYPTGIVIEPLAHFAPDFFPWRLPAGGAPRMTRAFWLELLAAFVERLAVKRLFFIYTYYGDRTYANFDLAKINWTGEDFGLGTLRGWRTKAIQLGFPAGDFEDFWPVEEAIRYMERIGGKVTLSLGQGSDLHYAPDAEAVSLGGSDPNRYGKTMAQRRTATIQRQLDVYDEYERMFGSSPAWDEVTLSHEVNILSVAEDWVKPITVDDARAITARANPRRVFLTPGPRVTDDLTTTATRDVIQRCRLSGVINQDGFSLASVGTYNGANRFQPTFHRTPFLDPLNSLNHDTYARRWTELAARLNAPGTGHVPGFEVRAIKEMFEFGFVGAGALTISNNTVGTGRTFTAGAPGFTNGTNALTVGSVITDRQGGYAIVDGVTSVTQMTCEIITPFEGTSVAAGNWRGVFDDPAADGNGGINVYRDPYPTTWINYARAEVARNARYYSNSLWYSSQYMCPATLSLRMDETRAQRTDFATRSNNNFQSAAAWRRGRDARLGYGAPAPGRRIVAQQTLTGTPATSGTFGRYHPVLDNGEGLLELRFRLSFFNGTFSSGVTTATLTPVINSINFPGAGRVAVENALSGGVLEALVPEFDPLGLELTLGWATTGVATVDRIECFITEYVFG